MGRPIAIANAAALFACLVWAPPCVAGSDSAAVEVMIETSDGMRIYGSWYSAGTESIGTLVLLHMLGKSRSSWNEFADSALTRHFSVLSIDFRGHGQSTHGKQDELSYQTMGQSQFDALVQDVDAAVKFVQARSGSAVYLIGASIGANVALNYAADNTTIDGVILLSPGEEYRGIRCETALRKYAGKPLFMVAALDDNYSALSVRALSAIDTVAVVEIYPTGGHGSYLLESRPELIALIFAQIARWSE